LDAETACFMLAEPDFDKCPIQPAGRCPP